MRPVLITRRDLRALGADALARAAAINQPISPRVGRRRIHPDTVKLQRVISVESRAIAAEPDRHFLTVNEQLKQARICCWIEAGSNQLSLRQAIPAGMPHLNLHCLAPGNCLLHCQRLRIQPQTFAARFSLHCCRPPRCIRCGAFVCQRRTKLAQKRGPLTLRRQHLARAGVGINWPSPLPAAVQINCFEIVRRIRSALRIKPRIRITGRQAVALAHRQRRAGNHRRRDARALAVLLAIEVVTKIVDFKATLPTQLHPIRITRRIELRKPHRRRRRWSRDRPPRKLCHASQLHEVVVAYRVIGHCATLTRPDT